MQSNETEEKNLKNFTVSGMNCAACQARVEKAVGGVSGVSSVSVNLLTGSMKVEGTASDAAIIKAVENAGYGAVSKNGKPVSSPLTVEDPFADFESQKLARRLAVSAIFLAVLMYIHMGHSMWGWPLPVFLVDNVIALAMTELLLAGAVMVVNQRFFTNGFKALFHGSPNMDTLVALGSSVSFVWSVYIVYRLCGFLVAGADPAKWMPLFHNQLYFESAAMIPALITVGKWLEQFSKGKTTHALKELFRLSPEKATVIRDGKEIEIAASEVRMGELFVLRPGDRVPVDGSIIEGVSALDESALTGESIPVDKSVGDSVHAATLNCSGYLRCRAERVGENTTLAQIIRMVSDAATDKAPIARVADRVSGIFVPAVIAVAAVVFFGWLIAGREIGFALARAISVLVISCPCALGLATPVAIMVGSGVGAKHGILFKSGLALETAGKIRIVALDKTGTVTTGHPQVTDCLPADENQAKGLLLLKAAALESKSEHPLAVAVVREAERIEIDFGTVEDFQIFPGQGLQGRQNGRMIRGGNRSFIEPFAPVPAYLAGKADDLSAQGKTPLFFAEENTLLGVIAVADTIKPDSPDAVRMLRAMGLRVIMLTGDQKGTAVAVGRCAGIDEIISDVMPLGKEKAIRTLQKEGSVAMVGDGINDAPALTRADVGIAIGSGTDVAVESADIVLMNTALMDLVTAVRLSRAVLRNIRENLFWAFFYNAVCIPLAAGCFGLSLDPMIAAAAMGLSSLTVCMNALRLNRFQSSSFATQPLKKNITTERKIILKTTLKIEGMMCPHCEAAVKKALESLSFVEKADVSHETGTAVLTLSGAVELDAVRLAVKETGYDVSGID